MTRWAGIGLTWSIERPPSLRVDFAADRKLVLTLKLLNCLACRGAEEVAVQLRSRQLEPALTQRIVEPRDGSAIRPYCERHICHELS